MQTARDIASVATLACNRGDAAVALQGGGRCPTGAILSVGGKQTRSEGATSPRQRPKEGEVRECKIPGAIQSRELRFSFAAESRIPAPEGLLEVSVENFGSSLQQEVCASRCPSHLLLLYEPFTDDLIDADSTKPVLILSPLR